MQTQERDIDVIAAAPPKGERNAPVRTQLEAGDDLRIDIFDSMAPLEAEWRALERDDLTSLHQSYDWCSAWVEAFRRPLAIIRGSIKGETAFILPLEITSRRGVRLTEFIGARHSNINTGLFSATFLASGELTYEQIAAIAAALRGKADLAMLRNVPLAWRGRRSPFALLASVENQNHAFQLPFLDSFEASLKQVNAKRRRKKFDRVPGRGVARG